MNILLLGSGGREHAMAWKMAQSHHCDKLFIILRDPNALYVSSLCLVIASKKLIAVLDPSLIYGLITSKTEL